MTIHAIYTSVISLDGLAVCQTAMIATAGQLLAQSESGAKRQQKSPVFRPNQRFPPGLEWEILNADAIVLQGLSHALRCVRF